MNQIPIEMYGKSIPYIEIIEVSKQEYLEYTRSNNKESPVYSLAIYKQEIRENIEVVENKIKDLYYIKKITGSKQEKLKRQSINQLNKKLIKLKNNYYNNSNYMLINLNDNGVTYQIETCEKVKNFDINKLQFLSLMINKELPKTEFNNYVFDKLKFND